jgi:hypothetical protein
VDGHVVDALERAEHGAHPALGSGKFGTPCERMHSECAKKAVAPLPVWLHSLPDVPQAVIARAQPVIAAANHRRRGGKDGWIASTGLVGSRPVITPS